MLEPTLVASPMENMRSVKSLVSLNSFRSSRWAFTFSNDEKVNKKSRPKNASAHYPTRHLAFGPGHPAQEEVNIYFFIILNILALFSWVE